MNLGLMIFIVAAAILFCGFYYFSLIISIAIWFPHKAKAKWVELTRSQGIEAFRWFWKWIAPVWLASMTVAIVFIAIQLAFALLI